MKKICAVLLTLTLMLSCLPLALAGQGVEGKWNMTRDTLLLALGAAGGDDYSSDVNSMSCTMEFRGDGTLLLTVSAFGQEETAAETWRYTGENSLSLTMWGVSYDMVYRFENEYLVLNDGTAYEIVLEPADGVMPQEISEPTKSAAESPIPTSTWTLSGGDWWNAVGQPGRADYYATVNVTVSFDAAGTLSYAETRMDNDRPMFNLEGTFTADETTCTVRGGGMELTAGYMIAGNSLVVTTPYGIGLFTRVEEPEVISSPIPTSSWTLTGGDWWNAVGQPGRADYYATVKVSVSFDAALGTVSYTETRMDNGRIMFNLEGTFAADETACTVQGGGMELTAGYVIAGTSLVVTTPYGIGLFTRAD